MLQTYVIMPSGDGRGGMKVLQPGLDPKVNAMIRNVQRFVDQLSNNRMPPGETAVVRNADAGKILLVQGPLSPNIPGAKTFPRVSGARGTTAPLPPVVMSRIAPTRVIAAPLSKLVTQYRLVTKLSQCVKEEDDDPDFVRRKIFFAMNYVRSQV